MIKFVARRSETGLITLGLVLTPDDLSRITSGDPEFCLLADVGLDHPLFEAVGIYFFRDTTELINALKEAGLDPRMVLGGKETIN